MYQTGIDKLVFQFSTASSLGFLDIASEWICRLTHSPFSHVDFVCADGNLLGASDNPSAPVIEGNPRGVAVRPPDYQKFHLRRRAEIITPHAKAIYRFAFQQLGKPFDNGALKARYFLSKAFEDRDWRDNDLWWCAELAARACEVGGLFPYPLLVVKNRVTAADLLLLLNPFIHNLATFWDPVFGLTLGPGEM